MTRVKICGICDAEAARAAAGAGADLVGFHFCRSLRRVSPEDARRIVESLERRPGVAGVFIDQDPDEVRQIADFVGLDVVQLHGSEAAGFTCGRPVMKVLKVKDGTIPGAADWPDPIMLDSWSADQRGGTGRTWKWELAADLVASRQVFIAGGLEPGNVGEVVSRFRPYGVDVSSGVESSIRHKDPERMAAFVRAVRAAEGPA